MWVRLTVDEDMLIESCEAATDHGPYTICPDAAPNFSRLAGLRIGRGFLKQAAERVGGVAGCTHLRELLQQLGTVAFQTLYPVRARKEAAGRTADFGAAAAQQLLCLRRLEPGGAATLARVL